VIFTDRAGRLGRWQLPISDTRFATEEEAESFEVSRAKEWIEKNAPSDSRT